MRWGFTPAAGYATAAARYPDDPAIIDEHGTVTFAELDRRTSAIARGLQEAGVGEGDRVALLCRNHRGFVEALRRDLQARRRRRPPQHLLRRSRSSPG